MRSKGDDLTRILATHISGICMYVGGTIWLRDPSHFDEIDFQEISGVISEGLEQCPCLEEQPGVRHHLCHNDHMVG
jgi:hypothetical protein